MSPDVFDRALWSVLVFFAWLTVPEVLVVFLFAGAVWAIATVALAYLAHRDLQREYDAVFEELNKAGKRVQELEKTIDAIEEGFCLPFPQPKRRA